MRRGLSRRVAAWVAVALAILLAALLSQADDPRATALAAWRVFRFPWGLALGGMAVVTVFDRKGR